MRILPRIQTSLLTHLLEVFPVVAVMGARQVGKSTLVQLPEVAAGRVYQSLDDIAVLEVARNDPRSLLRSCERLTLDEVQREPSLVHHIKQEVDRERVKGRFLLTGSSDLRLMGELSTWLAGRVGILELPPLTWREMEVVGGEPWIRSCLEAPNLKEALALLPGKSKSVSLPLEDHVFRGGYPEAALEPDPRKRHAWMEGYRQMYLERDVRQLSQIAHVPEFNRLMTLVCSRSAHVLSQSSLARSAGLKPSTTSRYLGLLEASFQIQRIVPYSFNIGKRQTRSPKLYWTDTGLALHLVALSDQDAVRRSGLWGAIIETAVVLEIDRHLKACEPSARLYYWRSHGGEEIDGVIERGARRILFEIKASRTLSTRDVRSLSIILGQDQGSRFGLVFYMGDSIVPLASNVAGVPVSALLV